MPLNNVRMTCRFDYNPSLCKDYHDTGYCSYGDSCIYLHDRGDYKSGWEMEKDWERE
jgi:RING finger protein 113A